MEYITYNNMIDTIRQNFRKIPKDVCGVIGIPRSGMLPATIISENLNVGLTTIETFIDKKTNGVNINEIFSKHGNRQLRNINKKKILVVDDTCYNGSETNKNRKLLEKFSEEIEFVFLVVYLEGNGTLSKPDIWLKDIRDLAQKSEIGIVLYEWNIFANPGIVQRTIYDLDGVMCVDPPDERNTEEYVKYLKNPIPLYFPTTDGIVVILTYRLNKYRKETEDFLKNNGIENFKLYMTNAETYEERGKIPAWLYKGNVYKNSDFFKLFVESDDFQAQKINEISGKAVYCVSTNKMYK